MSRQVIMEPGKVSTWSEFAEQSDPFSIALDGRVPGRNNYLLEGERAPILSIDHHSEVDRLGTRATCDQVLQMMRMGLRQRFLKNGLYVVNACVNDPDQDVCTSWYILNHPEIAEKANANPALNRLVAVESLMDATGGMYPFDRDMVFLGTMKAIYKPYTDFRKHGGIAEQDADAFKNVIFDVERRISDYIIGNHLELEPIDAVFEIERAGTNWSLIREIGEEARFGVVSAGIQAFISTVESGNNTWRYTIGKSSPLVDFPIEGLYTFLNQHDTVCVDQNRWGGSDIIGGSPRATGSKLNPDQLFELVESYVVQNAQAKTVF